MSGRVGSERHSLAVLTGLAPPATATDDDPGGDEHIASVTELAAWIAEANR